MEKKINKKQKEVQEAQFERARRKVLYDSQIIILEGQRNTVRELEKRAELMLNDFVESDNHVKKIITELNELSTQMYDNVTEEVKQN